MTRTRKKVLSEFISNILLSVSILIFFLVLLLLFVSSLSLFALTTQSLVIIFIQTFFITRYGFLFFPLCFHLFRLRSKENKSKIETIIGLIIGFILVDIFIIMKLVFLGAVFVPGTILGISEFTILQYIALFSVSIILFIELLVDYRYYKNTEFII